MISERSAFIISGVILGITISVFKSFIPQKIIHSKFWIGIGLFLTSVTGYVLYISSALAPTVLSKGTFPKTRVIYYSHVGSYFSAWTNYSRLINDVKEKYHIDLSHSPSFGIYYDNPSKTPTEKLRSIIGICLPDQTKIDSLLDYSFGIINQFDETREIVFPFRSDLSIMVNDKKGYPVINKFNHDNPTLDTTVPFEIYEKGPKTMKIIIGIGRSEGIMKEFPGA